MYISIYWSKTKRDESIYFRYLKELLSIGLRSLAFSKSPKLKPAVQLSPKKTPAVKLVLLDVISANTVGSMRETYV